LKRQLEIRLLKEARCKAEGRSPSEAYWRYAAASGEALQRRRWPFFSNLIGG
jgi:hypothetical protein